MVKVYIFELTQSISDKEESYLLSELDSSEIKTLPQQGGEKFEVSLIGKVLTKKIVSDETHVSKKNILIGKTKLGKPVIKPTNLNFDISISHSGNYLVIGICDNGKIAVSPRQIKDPVFGESIRRTGLVAAEVSALTPKICAILRGEVQSAVYFPQDGQSAALWDYAAGVLLVQEFGGRISSLCGADLPFRGADIIHKKGWLATREIDHTQLLACLNSLGEL